LAQQNDFSGAVEQFQTALRLQPQDAAVEANLGAALAEMGRYADARAHFQHALLLDPTQPIAKENLEALKEMNPR
jgi:Flp pilus assembly protein TadD